MKEFLIFFPSFPAFAMFSQNAETIYSGNVLNHQAV